MIHNVTIPFSFDTSPIEEMVAEIGEDKAEKVLEKVVRECISETMPRVYRRNGYGMKVEYDGEINWHAFVSERFDAWLEKYTQTIIDEAALLIAARATRRKAWRETLAELRENGDLDG